MRNVLVLQVVQRKYQQEYDIAPPITFADDHVALDIPDDGTQTNNGWEIVPLHKTDVSSRECVGIAIDSVCMCSVCVKLALWCLRP